MELDVEKRAESVVEECRREDAALRSAVDERKLFGESVVEGNFS